MQEAIPALRGFHALSIHRDVMHGYDIGAGDRFYDRAEVYSEAWSQSLKAPLRTIVVLSASRGKFGPIEYRIDTWDGATWHLGLAQKTSQLDFPSLFT